MMINNEINSHQIIKITLYFHHQSNQDKKNQQGRHIELLPIATIVLFTSTAITSVYITYLSHVNAKKTANKIIRLKDSLSTRMSSSGNVSSPVNQSWLMKEVFISKNGGLEDKLQNFFSTSVGATLFFVLIISSSIIGLLAGVFLSFINSSTALSFGIIPIVILVIYIMLVSQSEIFITLKYVTYMSNIDNIKLGMNDLKVLMRAEYILKARRKQFIIIAGLLVVYGFLGEGFDLLFVYLMGAVEVLFLQVFGYLINFLQAITLDFLILPLVLVAGATSVLIAIIFVYSFMKLVMLLIKLDVPVNLLPENLVSFRKDVKIPLSCVLWANPSSRTKRGVKK